MSFDKTMSFDKNIRQRIAQRVSPCPALEPYAQHAALLVDRTGLIEEANEEAARLLERTLDELRGSSFGVPARQWLRIELDVVTRDGKNRVIVARSVPSDDDRHSIILLEERDESADVMELVQLALADVSPLLMQHGLSAVLRKSVQGTTTSETRKLLARSIHTLSAMEPRRDGQLLVECDWSAEFLVITLWITGEPFADGNWAPFSDLIREVESAGGFLNVEAPTFPLEARTLRLIMPRSTANGEPRSRF